MLTAGSYNINIYKDEDFRNASADNMHGYDMVYIPDGDQIPITTIGINVFENGQLVNSAAVAANGGATGVHKNMVIAEEDRITLCCGDSVCCLSLPDLMLLWRTEADDASCFQLFKYQDSYIIHGELNISRIDRNGKIVWQRSGADIFTTLTGEDDFKLTDDLIIVKDFENRVYKFDYSGNDHTDKSQF